MKSKYLLLFLLFLPFIVVAEYNGHQIEFKIEFKDGTELIGYNYLASVYRNDKTISYHDFLEQNYEIILKNQFNDILGDFTYHANRIRYDYVDIYGNKSFIYTLIDKKDIDKTKIKSFKIIELTDQSYAIGISTRHIYKDRLWMTNEAIEKFSFGGIFCSNDIYIHEKNAKTDKIIETLKKASSEFDKRIGAQEEVMQYSNGAPYYQAEEKIKKIEEESDRIISDILQQFDGEKVVIITMCTC